MLEGHAMKVFVRGPVLANLFINYLAFGSHSEQSGSFLTKNVSSFFQIASFGGGGRERVIGSTRYFCHGDFFFFFLQGKYVYVFLLLLLLFGFFLHNSMTLPRLQFGLLFLYIYIIYIATSYIYILMVEREQEGKWKVAEKRCWRWQPPEQGNFGRQAAPCLRIQNQPSLPTPPEGAINQGSAMVSYGRLMRH